MMLFLYFKLRDSRWHLWFIQGTKELTLRFNIHPQKHSPSSFPACLCCPVCPFQCPALCLGWPASSPAGSFLQFQHSFQCGRWTEPWETAAPCMSLVPAGRMLVQFFCLHIRDLFIYKIGTEKPAIVLPLCTKMLLQTTWTWAPLMKRPSLSLFID